MGFGRGIGYSEPVPPSWDKWYGATLHLTHSEQIVSVAKFYNQDALIAIEYKQAYSDAPADYIKRLTPAVALADAEAIVIIDQTYNKNAIVGREGGGQLLVDGAIADDGGVTTDQTAAAREATANDMTLLPAIPAVNDAYYFGFNRTYNIVWLNVSTAGSGNWGFAHEYWNGLAWAALSGVVDATDEFTTGGLNRIQFTRPGDWATTDVGGVLAKYWTRARVVSYVSIVTQPLGAQAWCEVLA